MTKNEIVETLTAQYSRDIRKQIVRSLVASEKNEDTAKQYKLMNQIFSYVLAQLGWTMASSTENWDNSPLEIMEEVFPKIETSKWFDEQKLIAKQSIDVQMGDIR